MNLFFTLRHFLNFVEFAIFWVFLFLFSVKFPKMHFLSILSKAELNPFFISSEAFELATFSTNQSSNFGASLNSLPPCKSKPRLIIFVSNRIFFGSLELEEL